MRAMFGVLIINMPMVLSPLIPLPLIVFASGNVHFTAKLNTTQTWYFANHSINTMDSYALDSICIHNGILQT